MRIENSNIKMVNLNQANEQANENENLDKKDIASTIKEDPAAVYEKSDKDLKTDKNGHIYDAKAIARLKQQTEENKLRIFDLIRRAIGKQSEVISYLELDDIVEVPEDVRLEAQELIGPDGEFGIEKTSDRIVDFAKAISGGNPAKAEILRDAIDKGFKEAERALGGELPQISQDTYARVMEKLDAWVAGEEAAEPVIDK